MGFWKMLSRGLRLQCPACGKGKLYRGYVRMNRVCEACQITFEREPGYFLGAIYFNYGLTSIIVAVAYPMMMFLGGWDKTTRIAVTLTFAVLFPLWFFRYARSLWLALDQLVDPRPEE